MQASVGAYADEVVLHIGGRSPIAGDYHGLDDFRRYVHVLTEQLRGDFEIAEIHDVVANDEHTVALLRERAVREGRSFVFNRVIVYHVRGGKISEIWVHEDDQTAVDEFFSS